MKTGRCGLLRNAAGVLLATALALPAQGGELPELECLIEPYVVIDIGSPTHGIVDELAVDRSDVVERNDVLAKLDSTQQAAAVRKARARVAMESEIETREAELELARRKQQRMRELYNSDAISSHARDEVETELKRAEMQLRQARDARQLARIELERARDDLERRTIRSPISGVIVERFVAPGEYVNEKPLMRLAQLHPLRIEAIAPAALFGEISPGMQATVATAEGGAKSHSATVTIVDKMIDAASGTFGIRLELPNADYAIPSGLNCRLQVLAQPSPGPRSASAMTDAGPTGTRATPPVAEPERVCRTLGPFADTTARDALMSELADVAATVRTRDESVEVDNGYLVLTQRAEDIAAARRLAADLKTRGVNDVAVLVRGQNAGRVSLGYFADKARAEIRQQNLKKIGVEAQLHERHKSRTQLWLDARLPAEAIEQAPWKQIKPPVGAIACDPQHYVAEQEIGLARTSD